ncbi:MAG: hypothetical protein KF830_08375 [Planctomycetes bacterium]|nr:hypothetical protein [Planctomycetota bacterium]
MTPAAPPPQRLAAAWFLGVMALALVVVAWLRGAGRLLLPVLVVGLTAFAVVRLVRAVLRPLP